MKRYGASSSQPLSLSSFARAKESTYDKRAVLAHQRVEKAKKLRRYRKLQERDGGAEPANAEPASNPYDDVFQGDEEERLPPPPPLPGQGGPLASRRRVASAPTDGAARKRSRPFNSLEALAQKNAAEREEAAAAAAAEAQAAAERRALQEGAQAARRAQGAAMRKRNARGQPLMKYRIDAILGACACLCPAVPRSLPFRQAPSGATLILEAN